MKVSELQHQINTFRQYTVADMITALQQLPQDAIVSAGSTMFDGDYHCIYRPHGHMLHLEIDDNRVSVIDEEIGHQLLEDTYERWSNLHQKRELLIAHYVLADDDDGYETVKHIGCTESEDDYEIVCALEPNDDVHREIEYYMQDEVGVLFPFDNMIIAYDTHDYHDGHLYWVVFKRIPNPLYKNQIES